MPNNAFKYAFIVAFGGFIFGLDAALISGTVDFVSSEFGLTDLQKGLVVSSPGWGVLLALLAAGYVVDKLGRKRTLQIIAILYLVSALCSTFAPSYWALVSARFIGGLAFTSLSLAAMYIGEIAPSHLRGQLVAMNQINIVVGLSAAYFINYLILQTSKLDAAWVADWGISTHTWRWMLGSEIMPALLWSLLLLFIPRSPRWLVLKDKLAEAKTVLAKLMPQEQIETEIVQIQESLAQENLKLSFSEQIKKLFDTRLKKAIIIGLTFAIVQQTTGINAILFYAPTVFSQLGLGTDAAFVQAVWVGVCSVIATVLALLLIDKIGRRPMTIWGLLWAVVSLGICAYGFHQATYTLTPEDVASIENLNPNQLQSMIGIEYASDVDFKAALKEKLGAASSLFEGTLIQKAGTLPGTMILFGIMSFIAAFQFSVGPIMWIIFSEIFPTRVRGIAIPACALVTSLVSVLIQQFFPWQLTNMGARDIFLFYALTSAVGLVALFQLLPETKNKTIEEIEAELQ
ncbi:MAG: sugar porter family MFS transporter [Bacteroidota bacterium]